MTPRTFAQHRFATPADAAEILLVRHGESEPYVEGAEFPLADGHGDPALAPNGIVHAEATARRLADSGEPISAVYVTTLRRTTETAAPLLARLNTSATVIADLREVYLGEWEGGELRRRWADGDPIAAEVAATRRWELIPGAESKESFDTRIRSGIAHIVDRHRGQLAVAVVHGGVIERIMHLAAGTPQGGSFIPVENCSITHLVVDAAGAWQIRCFNDTGHLWPTFSTRKL